MFCDDGVEVPPLGPQFCVIHLAYYAYVCCVCQAAEKPS